MRRGMATSGGHDDASSRSQAMEDAEENAPNGSIGKNKRAKVVDEGRTSSSQSTLNLVNCILGPGVLGYPFCFRSCGLLLGTLIMAASYTASRFSYNLLLYCSQISNKRTYEDLAEQAVGKAGRQIVQLCTAALNLGCIVAYLNILADVLSSVAGTIIPPGAEPSRNAFITGVSIFGALPVALWVRDHATIATFMMASVGFVILFAVVVVVFALAPNPMAAAAGAVALWQPEGLLVALPVVVFSFTAHPYYLAIFNNLHGPTFERMGRVTNVAMGLSGALYWIVGVFGYLTFRNRTAGDILRNFGAVNVEGLRGAYERAIKLCYGLSILGSVPLVILPFYSLMVPLLGFKGRTDYALGGAGSGGERSGSFTKRTSSGSLTDEVSDRLPTSVSYSLSPTVGSPPAGRRSLSKVGRTGSHELDVVDLKLHADREGDDVSGELCFWQHALVVLVVLGTSLATAIWVPNIEFIFGLTGATASVLLSYILPALTFIKLMDLNPELLGGGNFKVIPETVRNEWLWRKRKAIVLLCFGVVSGIMCTDAILSAVKQEAAVVHLAQQLVAHEVVVAETAKVQQKARAAVTAMSAVELAAKELGQANVNATGTFNKLQQAAAQLDTIAGGNVSTASKGHEWAIQTLVKEHKQHVAENKVLKAVELVLADVKDEVRRTAAGVSGVITQLDAAIAQLSAEGSAGAGTALASGSNTTASAASNCEAPLCSTVSAEAGKGASSSSSGSGSSSGLASTTGGSSSGSAASTRDRAADLALELGKALGAFSSVAANTSVAGKSLAQVRSTAVSTLLALNQTAAVLEHVSAAVEAAKKSHKHDDDIKRAAVVAMQLALNATATSALAMQLTGEALQRSATAEASELLDMLVQVSHDLEKTSSKAKVTKTRRVDGSNINTTVAAATASGTSSTTTGAVDVGSTGAAGGGAAGSSGLAAGGADAVGATTADGRAAANGAGAANSDAAGGASSGGSVEAPAATAGSTNRAAEAAGQLEQVIKDLNDKLAAAINTSVDTARAAAAAAAAAATSSGHLASGATTHATGSTADGSASTSGQLAGGTVAHSGAASAATSAAAETAASSAAAVAAAALLASNATAIGAGGALGGGLNVSGIAAALQDAVAVTKVKQDEALQEIQNSLTNTDAKVAERVVDILKDFSETSKDVKGAKVGSAGSAGGSGTATGMEAVLSAGGGEMAVGATASGIDSSAGTDAGSGSVSTGSSTGSTLEDALLGLVHKITDRMDDFVDVEGPVVKVDAEGHLIQEDNEGDGIVGPTVRNQDSLAGKSAESTDTIHEGSGASGRDTSGETAQDARSIRQHRKLGIGLGLGLSKPG